MSYFKDLSDYAYLPDSRPEITRIAWFGLNPETSFSPPRVKNVGWLGRGHQFPTQAPPEETLELLWDYCAISVNQTRGVHPCDFCLDHERYLHRHAERNGQRKLLGSAEIRVFGANGDVYAAPTLVYHYVSVHSYSPPHEFVLAMKEGSKPATPEYFRKLEKLGLEWNKAALPKSHD